MGTDHTSENGAASGPNAETHALNTTTSASELCAQARRETLIECEKLTEPPLHSRMRFLPNTYGKGLLADAHSKVELDAHVDIGEASPARHRPARPRRCRCLSTRREGRPRSLERKGEPERERASARDGKRDGKREREREGARRG